MSQSIVPPGITSWLKTRDKEGDKLLSRRGIIDLCDGDHLAAMMFSQILYYHLPDKTAAGTKLRIQKDGWLWVAKKYTDWQEECRINEHTARKKIDWLKSTGLVLTQNFMFNGLKVLHLRIDFECMAARLAALHPVGPVRPERSDGERQTRTDRVDREGQTGPTPPDEPITETTPYNTDKEDTPQPSPDGEGAFSASPGINTPGEDDASSDKDWLSITNREDRTAAEAVSRLFPADPNTPLTSSDVARKFVKRRRGVLGGNAAMVLARWFRTARFEGTIVPAWRCVRTFSELLDVNILAPALQASRAKADERLEEIDSMIDVSNCFDLGVQQIGYLDKMVESGIDLVAFSSGRHDLPAVCSTIWRKQLPGLSEVQTAHRAPIMEALVDQRYWLQIHSAHCANVFGIGDDDIQNAQEAYWKPLEAEKADIISLLG